VTAVLCSRDVFHLLTCNLQLTTTVYCGSKALCLEHKLVMLVLQEARRSPGGLYLAVLRALTSADPCIPAAWHPNRSLGTACDALFGPIIDETAAVGTSGFISTFVPPAIAASSAPAVPAMAPAATALLTLAETRLLKHFGAIGMQQEFVIYYAYHNERDVLLVAQCSHARACLRLRLRRVGRRTTWTL
jgi:hypothetical protein